MDRNELQHPVLESLKVGLAKSLRLRLRLVLLSAMDTGLVKSDPPGLGSAAE